MRTNTVSVTGVALNSCCESSRTFKLLGRRPRAVGRNTSNVLFLMHLMRHAGNATCVRGQETMAASVEEDLHVGPFNPKNGSCPNHPATDSRRALMANWYRRVLEANQNWLRWSGKEAQG